MFGIDDAIVGGLVSGGLGLLGSSLTNDANSANAAAANAMSQQQFETRYQTTVKDMQAAGLNPMLAYSQGGGSPPVAQQAPPKHDVVSSAVGGYTGQMQREILKQQAINMAQEGALTAEKLNTQKHLTQDAFQSAQLKFDQDRELNLRVMKEQFKKDYYMPAAQAEHQQLLNSVDEAKQRILTGQATASQYKALTDQVRQATKFQGYDEQRLKNLSDAEKSAIKSKLSPYLPELKLLLQSLP